MNIMTPDGVKIGGNAFLDLLINGASVGSDGVGVVAIKSGVPPVSSPDNVVQLYCVLNYASEYPPDYSDTYVKATTKYSTSYWPHFSTNPGKSLTGAWSTQQWIGGSTITTNQRFHIDLGSAKVIKRIYYENAHSSGIETDAGVQNFTFWGSNSAASFAELTYGTDTGWTQITTAQSTFDQHTASDVADPKYITITNTTAYRYYAFKFADNYGDVDNGMGVRRIELQSLSGLASAYPPNYSDAYVKATTKYSTSYWPHFSTDPGLSLIGAVLNNAWFAADVSVTNQRFHIDLGSSKTIKRIYYENTHSSGTETNRGVQNFTFWGSNSAASFAELTYATDTGWTQITTTQTVFIQHVASNVIDPHYISVNNTIAYRYYAFKFADNYGATNWLGVRRIELQEESSELQVRDTSGNVTTLSPHNFSGISDDIMNEIKRDSDGLAWSYHSSKDGKEITVDMFNAIRDLEALTGNKYIYSNPNTSIQSIDPVALQKIRDNIISQVKPVTIKLREDYYG